MTLLKRKLGQTDLLISALGLGTVKLGRNTDVKYPNSFNIPTDQEAADLLALAKELNINLVDTAPSYGNSEQRLGKLLKNQRHDWVIVGKAGENYEHQQSIYNFNRDAVLNSIKHSLQNLNTDYIDLLLIHSDGNDERIIMQDEVFNTLADAKQQGLIRYYGMSTKTVAGGLLTLQHSDVAMVMCNPNYNEENAVIASAHKSNKGILIKKAFGSGHVNKIVSENPIQACMDYIWQQAGVNSIVLGTINPEHLKQNVACAIQSLNSFSQQT
jgi:aryl-alcohol dehydrogenase-like predicted oxidoreductase